MTCRMERLYGFYSYYLPGYEGVEEERAESVVI